MGGIFSNRDNLVIPDSVFDEYNWGMDAFLDGPPGKQCLLIYPQKKEECPNCYSSQETGRSTDIWKISGPQQFDNFTICPLCNGIGYLSTAPTESIRLRFYQNVKDWINTGTSFQAVDGLAQIIGYMTDFSKVQRAVSIIINSDLQAIEKWEFRKYGAGISHGLNNRYFAQLIQRIS
jgi:hypothetical protein